MNIKPTAPPLNVSVVVDYENMRRTALKVYAQHEGERPIMLDPLALAQRIVSVRAANPNDGHRLVLRRVIVVRAEAIPIDRVRFARSQMQHEVWRSRSDMIEIRTTPLHTTYEYDADGARVYRDGRPVILGHSECGVDVMVALSALDEARRADTNIVIVASHDRDLCPTFAFVRAERAKAESACWSGGVLDVRPLNAPYGEPALWSNHLSLTDYTASIDPTDYTDVPQRYWPTPPRPHHTRDMDTTIERGAR